MSTPELENMSDDELLNLEAPPEVDEETIQATDENDSEEQIDNETTESVEEVEEPISNEPEYIASHDVDGEAEGEAPAEPEGEPAEFDYKAAYEAVAAPFKANGKEMSVESPDEIRRMMQMGANYTQKMQGLAPNIKLMRMLENNNLLEPEKISHLIDLSKNDPKAIQKLLHESGLDPLDIDTTEKPDYVPSNHTISDAENRFRDALDVAMTTELGQEAVSMVNSEWDQASKNRLFDEPEILDHLIQHKESGLFKTITSELERQKILGNYVNDPFIDAYNKVGDYLHQQGKLAPASAETSKAVSRTARPAPVKSNNNGSQVRAAATPRSQPKPAKKAFDPFAMSDEEIEAMARPPQ